MGNSKLKITDIARLTGFSKSTVSAAMNGKPGISKKNRQIVLDAIAKVGYEPNAAARGLVTKRSGSIAMVIGDINIPLFNKAVAAVEAVADRHGYTLLLASTGFDYAKEVNAVNVFMSKQVDGMIVTAMENVPNHLHLSAVELGGVPLAIIGKLNGLNVYTVEQDDYIGAVQAMQHIVKLGHRRIAHVKGPNSLSSTHVRIQAYKNVLLENSLSINPSFLLDGGLHQEDGYRAGKALLQMNDRPTAAFCFNDLIAIGVATAYYDAGLRIPGDLSLIGCDALDMLPIPLTSVRFPLYEMAQQAADYVMRRIKGETELTPTVSVFPSELVDRGSVRFLE
jgi:LacI family transcriptional regulator